MSILRAFRAATVGALLSMAPAKVAQDVNGPFPGLDTAWTLAGNWTGVAPDRGEAVGALRDGYFASVGPEGGFLAEPVRLEGAGERLRLLHSKKDRIILTYTPWSTELSAFGSNGKQLWSHPDGEGINEVAVIEGPEAGYAAVGHNGSTGIALLDARGKIVWSNKTTLNVWGIDGWASNGSSAALVVTSVESRLHVFEKNAGRVDLRLSFVPHTVCVSSQRPLEFLSTGPRRSDRSRIRVAAVAVAGSERWSIDLPHTGDWVDSMAATNEPSWLAIGVRGGAVYVIEVVSGHIIGYIDGMGFRPQLAWMLRRDAPPLLVVASGNSLSAFHVPPKPTEKEEGPK